MNRNKSEQKQHSTLTQLTTTPLKKSNLTTTNITNTNSHHVSIHRDVHSKNKIEKSTKYSSLQNINHYVKYQEENAIQKNKITKKKNKKKKNTNTNITKTNKLSINLNKNKKTNTIQKTTCRYQKQSFITNNLTGVTTVGFNNISSVPSCREYCVIDGNFVPIASSNDKRHLDCLLADTAVTSPQFIKSPFFYEPNTPSHKLLNLNQYSQQHPRDSTAQKDCYKQQQQYQQQQYQQEYQQQEQQQLQYQEQNKQLLNRSSEQQTSINNCTIQSQLKNYSTMVKAAQQDIGIQYSDRKNLLSVQRIMNLKQQPKTNLLENLSQLVNHQSLQLSQLNTVDRRKYRQVLYSIIKNMQSPRPEITPRRNQKINEDSLVIASLKISSSNNNVKSTSKCIEEKYEEQEQYQDNFQDEENYISTESNNKTSIPNNPQLLQQLLFSRQAKQLGQIPIILRNTPNMPYQQTNTSILAILNIFENFFCFIEVNYLQQILKSINKMYGWSYMDKYCFISKMYRDPQYLKNEKSGFQITQQILQEIKKRQSNFNIVSESIIQEFIQQLIVNGNSDEDISVQGISAQDQNIKPDNICEIYHTHCVLSAINSLLRTYQPFYSTKGDSFPWSLNIFKCFTFYSIDQQSITVVISELRHKLLNQISKTLCGIIIQQYQLNNNITTNNNNPNNINNSYITDIITNSPLTLFSSSTNEETKNMIQQHRNQREQKMLLEQYQKQENIVINQYAEYQIFSTAILHEISLKITGTLIQQVNDEILSIIGL